MSALSALGRASALGTLSARARVDSDRAGPRLFFQRVPEPKATKNRVHLDVNVGGGMAVPPAEPRQRVAVAIERLTQLGARQLRTVDGRGEYWVVMQDPEGNEFC